jgi:hypothetical protein
MTHDSGQVMLPGQHWMRLLAGWDGVVINAVAGSVVGDHHGVHQQSAENKCAPQAGPSKKHSVYDPLRNHTPPM